MLKTREHTIAASIALKDKIWQRWTETNYWPQDDSDTKEAKLFDKPAIGVQGYVIPARGPKSKIEVTNYKPNHLFYLRTRLPLTTMSFEHEMVQQGAELQLTHRVTFTGPLSSVFDKLIGRAIAKGFPTVMQNIVEHSKNM